MPTYEFLCQNNDCQHYETKMLQLSFIRETPNWNRYPCSKCGYLMDQTFTEVPGLVFKEGHGVESAKPLSYWNNAEKVKQENIKKKKAVEKEKLHSGDPEAVQKRENLKKNVAAMNDTAPDNIIIKEED